MIPLGLTGKHSTLWLPLHLSAPETSLVLLSSDFPFFPEPYQTCTSASNLATRSPAPPVQSSEELNPSKCLCLLFKTRDNSYLPATQGCYEGKSEITFIKVAFNCQAPKKHKLSLTTFTWRLRRFNNISFTNISLQHLTHAGI